MNENETLSLLIMQGTNESIEIEFDESVSEVHAISVTLCSGNLSYMGVSNILKHWSKPHLTIDGSKAYCPLSQQETMSFPAGDAYLEVKLMVNGTVMFFEKVKAIIGSRKDRSYSL